MAVIDFRLLTDREGSIRTERKGVLTEIQVRVYYKRFRVITDDIADGPQKVRSGFGMPRIGEPYINGNDADILATCVDIDVKATASPFVWMLVATYDTSRLVDVVVDNPLNQPAEISWAFTEYERPLVRDARGVSLVNTSGEAFDPPLTVPDSRPVVTITRNEPFFSPALAVAYQDAVNLDIFAGALPRAAKVNAINGVRQIDLGLVYYKVTYEIQFRRELFDLYVLDQGYRDINKKLFRDPVDFAPLSNPTLLNGKGKRLTDATTTTTAALGVFDQTVAVTDGVTAFPPDGLAGLQHAGFEVRIDNEVMRVVSGMGTNTWTVIRGFAGTTPATHGNGATVKLEPYYLVFWPHKVLSYAPLRLPVI